MGFRKVTIHLGLGHSPCWNLLLWYHYDQHPNSLKGEVVVAGTTEVALVTERSEETDEILATNL